MSELPPKPALYLLHGYGTSGGVIRRQLGKLLPLLEERFDVRALDAPWELSERAVAKMVEKYQIRLPEGAHLAWWFANHGAGVYEGYQTSVALLEAQLDAPYALLGFSQGAAFAALVAALAEAGRLPPPEFVVMVGGFVANDPELRAFFSGPLETESLHVIGEKDNVVGKRADELADCFSEDGRTVVRHPGGHDVPRRGAAFEELTSFLLRERKVLA